MQTFDPVVGKTYDGRIAWDPSSRPGEHQPLCVIDGKEIPWDELGKIFMTHEGFRFKMQIYDASDNKL